MSLPPLWAGGQPGAATAARSGGRLWSHGFETRIPWMRNSAAVEKRNQPRLLQQQLRDRRWRHVFGRGEDLTRSLRPHEGQFNIGVRSRRGFEQLQCRAQHGALTVRIVRLTEAATRGITNAGEPRHANGASQLGNPGKCHGGDAARLDDVLNQSYGPATEGSYGYQRGRVDAFRPHSLGDGRCRLRHQLLGLQDIAHRRVVGRSGASDHSFAGQLLQSAHR